MDFAKFLPIPGLALILWLILWWRRDAFIRRFWKDFRTEPLTVMTNFIAAPYRVQLRNRSVMIIYQPPIAGGTREEILECLHHDRPGILILGFVDGALHSEQRSHRIRDRAAVSEYNRSVYEQILRVVRAALERAPSPRPPPR